MLKIAKFIGVIVTIAVVGIIVTDMIILIAALS